MDFKKLLPIGIIIAIIAIIAFWVVGVKNSALEFSQASEKEWGNVQTAYQRRKD